MNFLKNILLLIALFPGSATFSQHTLIFEENFDNNTEGWGVNNYKLFRNGCYEILRDSSYSTEWMEDKSPVQISATDNFSLEVKFSMYDYGSEEGFTLLFGKYNENHIYATVYADGKFQFLLKDRFRKLTYFSDPAFFAGDKKNLLLKIERRDKELIAFVNGQETQKIPYPSSYIAGFRDIGFKNSAELHTKIDYLKIYKEIVLTPPNFAPLQSIYPEFKKTDYDKEKLYDKEILYAGCAEGDCINGTGTYIKVSTEDKGRDDEFNLKYLIYKGRFDNNSKKFTGDFFVKRIKVRKKGKARIVPATNNNLVTGLGPAELHIDGEFRLYTADYARPEVLRVIPEGSFNADEIAKEKYKFKKCSGIKLDRETLFTELEYANGNTFAGLVDNDYMPLIGKYSYFNGDVYEGSFINDTYEGPGRLTREGKTTEGVFNAGQCIKQQKVFIPSVDLLRKAAKDFGANQSMMLQLNPLQVQYEQQILLKGKLYNSNGDLTDTIKNGPGLFYGRFGDYCKIYIGEIKNNVPDGYGLALYKRAAKNDYKNNYKESLNYYSGVFVNGVMKEGRFKHKVLNEYGSEWDYEMDIQKIEVHPALADAMKLFSAGKSKEGVKWLQDNQDKNAEAAYMLGLFYKAGTWYYEDTKKAYQLFEKAAKAGSMMANLEMGKAYYRGSNGFTINNVLALEYFNAASKITPLNKKMEHCLKNEISYYYFTLKYAYYYTGYNITLFNKFSVLDENSPAFKEMLAAIDARNAAANSYTPKKPEGAVAVWELSQFVGSYWFYVEQFKSPMVIKITGYEEPQKGVFQFTAKAVMENSCTNSPCTKFDIKFSAENLLRTPDFGKKFKIVTFNYTTETCGTCRGSGYTVSGVSHTSDYTFTLGAKITYTATSTKSCLACNGSGWAAREHSDAPYWDIFWLNRK